MRLSRVFLVGAALVLVLGCKSKGGEESGRAGGESGKTGEAPGKSAGPPAAQPADKPSDPATAKPANDNAPKDGSDIPGPPRIELGAEATVAALAKVFPSRAKIEEGVLTAEGDPIGKTFDVRVDDELWLIAFADAEGPINRIEYHGHFFGPGNVKPGKSSFEETHQALELKDCHGGIEDSAEQIMCSTKLKGVAAIFPSSIDTAEKQLDTAAAKKALAGKALESLSLAEPADTSIMTLLMKTQ